MNYFGSVQQVDPDGNPLVVSDAEHQPPNNSGAEPVHSPPRSATRARARTSPKTNGINRSSAHAGNVVVASGAQVYNDVYQHAVSNGQAPFPYFTNGTVESDAPGVIADINDVQDAVEVPVESGGEHEEEEEEEGEEEVISQQQQQQQQPAPTTTSAPPPVAMPPMPVAMPVPAQPYPYMQMPPFYAPGAVPFMQFPHGPPTYVSASIAPQAQAKSKRRQVKNACVPCQKACKKCDDCRPCVRCTKYGIGDSCTDSMRKERAKGVKRGPYNKQKQRDGKAEPTGFIAVGHPIDPNDPNAMAHLHAPVSYYPAYHGIPVPPPPGGPYVKADGTFNPYAAPTYYISQPPPQADGTPAPPMPYGPFAYAYPPYHYPGPPIDPNAPAVYQPYAPPTTTPNPSSPRRPRPPTSGEGESTTPASKKRAAVDSPDEPSPAKKKKTPKAAKAARPAS